MPIDDASFRAGFEAAKKAAIECAEYWRYWNLREHSGCKAVQGAIEHIERLDVERFNHDGTLKPEVYVEYDRAKHGPIVDGKVKLISAPASPPSKV